MVDDIEYYDIVLNMKPIYLAGLLSISSGLVVCAGPAASSLEQREQSFVIHLNGSVKEVTSLFGPVREAEWAPGWKPEFIHPRMPEQREGAVFITNSKEGKDRLWLLTTFKPQEGRVEYVCVMAGFTANQIKIDIVSDGEKQCKATITYRHSALAPEGNKEVVKLDGHWAEQQRTHWQNAMNTVLAKVVNND